MFTKNAFTVAGGYPEEHGFDTQGFAWRFLAQNLHAETCPDTNYLHRVKASKSYYLREYGSGNINFNWQKIFVEHLDLFNDEAKRFILQYKCQDFTENIFDKMKIKARVLDDNYKEAILTGRIIEKSSFLNQERPVSKNSLRGIFFRMRSRFKKSFANDSVIYESIKSIRSTISEIKGRLHSERNLKLIFAVLLLKIKRLLKIQFEMEKPKLASPIDIVIPTLNKDLVLLESYLIYLRKNLMHEIMNIYIVAPASDPYLISYCTENNLIFIDEKKVLGYGKEAISYKVGEVDRSGWLFQQLLKLSGDVFVKNKNYLIIDSDTILINNHCFLYGSKTVFLASSEWNEPYFKSFSRLFGFVNKTPLSFTAHMMLFNVDKLREMKADISKLHKKTWDKAYIESCDRSEMSGISDYDTYAQWYMEKYPDQAIIIPFYNKSMPRARHKELSSLSTKCSCSFNSLSFHSYN